MEKEYKIVPFDVEKAKAGAEVVTRKDKLKVEILKYDVVDESPILAVVTFMSGKQCVCLYYLNGKRLKNDISDFDLRIRKELKYRRMTNQELSWWLRECPEEHREYKFKTNPLIYHDYIYKDDDVNKVIDDRILIRSNGGEWKEPLIEIND